jgi:CheY-like chemotaxis protein
MTTQANATRRILLVDDEEVVRDSIRQLLALDGHEIETAASGKEALAAFQAGKFDLVILDYEMPGMKGDKLAAAIRTLAPQMPIIMMTAYGDALRLSGDFPLAVNAQLSKPFDLQELREVVRRATTKVQRTGPILHSDP